MICFACHSSSEMESDKLQIKSMDNEIWNPLIILSQQQMKIVKAKSKKLYKNNDDMALLVGNVMVDFYGDEGDILILISSSGSSANVVNAAKRAKELNIGVITFSGFKNNNPLRNLGDINFWVDSKAYNIIEMTHHIWLLSIVDYIIGGVLGS